MGSVNPETARVGFLPESVDASWRPVGELAALLADLDRPWVATEGPLDARLFRHEGGDLEARLLLRGFAFDGETTVAWDEEAVQLVRRAPAEPEVLAMPQSVLIRERLRGDGPEAFLRIDYLHHGALRASRWMESTSVDPNGRNGDA